jgi:peroxiredoxin
MKMRSIIILFVLSLTAAGGFAQSNHPVAWKFNCIKIAPLTYNVQFHAIIKEPFHIYPTQSSGGGLGMPTEFLFEDDDNIELIGGMEEKGVEPAAGETAHYAKGVTFMQRIKLQSDKRTTLRFRIKYMACTDSYCLPPASKKFTLDLSDRGSDTTDIDDDKTNPDTKQAVLKYEDFVLPDTEGKNVSSGNIISKNKYTFIDFWASWCMPCRAQGRELIPIFNSYHQKGFEVIGISLDTDSNAWKKAIQVDGYPWTNLSDLKGFESAISRKYGISEIPRNFLIDSNGNIVAKDLHGKTLEAKLAELFGN